MRLLNTAGQALLDRAIAGERIPMFTLVHVALQVPQYFAIGGLPLLWDSHVWAPLDIALSQQADSVAEFAGIELTLPGVDVGQIALAFDEVDGAALRLWLALVDPDTGVVGDALPMWSGELDMPGFIDGPKAQVLFKAEHRGTLFTRAKVSRLTSDEQQRRHPGDTCLRRDPGTDTATYTWPAASWFYK